MAFLEQAEGQESTIPTISYRNWEELWELLPKALDGQFALRYSEKTVTQSVASSYSEDDRESEMWPTVVPADTALIVETSGSTGNPKRVMLSAKALRSSAEETEKIFGKAQWILALPVNYIAGVQVLVRALLAEIPPIICLPFSAQDLVKKIASVPEDTRLCTSLVPAQLDALIDYITSDKDGQQYLERIQKFQAILVGGQSTSQKLKQRAKQLGLPIVTTYGSSETSGGCVYNGRAFANVSLDTVDGELLIAGPQLALGYLNDPDRTATSFVERKGIRWYRTGDRAEILEDGTLTILGRKDELFISGGIKVDLQELKTVIKNMPGLHDAEIVVVNHDSWGQIPVIVYDGRLRIFRPDIASIRDGVETALGKAAKPHTAIALNQPLPQLASGKLDIQTLTKIAQEYIEEEQ